MGREKKIRKKQVVSVGSLFGQDLRMECWMFTDEGAKFSDSIESTFRLEDSEKNQERSQVNWNSLYF